ncbi:hypothetical protein H696_03731 [Fonticula alba]|uniref:Uncharacterized protein n=1 Tax=Fonticula alba TaxID=691883 RepID=A0A058Z590_FONAL|nr:hypothetical protein H696_03731 [Fonticula alba]KCV69296.1 hypothetical protein H696_03731 [Fonticula alba]|eukprot:XP_009495861.1 hypothetical protein H696_03731 [Fonticula alba]
MLGHGQSTDPIHQEDASPGKVLAGHGVRMEATLLAQVEATTPALLGLGHDHPVVLQQDAIPLEHLRTLDGARVLTAVEAQVLLDTASGLGRPEAEAPTDKLVRRAAGGPIGTGLMPCVFSTGFTQAEVAEEEPMRLRREGRQPVRGREAQTARVPGRELAKQRQSKRPPAGGLPCPSQRLAQGHRREGLARDSRRRAGHAGPGCGPILEFLKPGIPGVVCAILGAGVGLVVVRVIEDGPGVPALASVSPTMAEGPAATRLRGDVLGVLELGIVEGTAVARIATRLAQHIGGHRVVAHIPGLLVMELREIDEPGVMEGAIAPGGRSTALTALALVMLGLRLVMVVRPELRDKGRRSVGLLGQEVP